MNKALSNIFAIVLAGMAAVGCTDQFQVGDSFLNKAPGATTNLDSIFSNPDYVNQFLTNIYNKQYYGLPYNSGKNQAANPYNGKLDALTDLYQMHWSSCKVWNSYYSGTFSPKEDPLISFANDYVWETVHQVSLIKENIDKCTGLTEHQKKYIIAQAKALQAFAYSNLLPYYGGLPIIERTIESATEDDGNGNPIGARKTFDETVEAIVRWCDEAKDDLYWAYNGNDAESSSLQTGRWTKAGVMALKAKVLWIAASPLYNADAPYYDGTTEAEQQKLVWYGDFQQSRWERALKAFEDFWAENQKNGENYHLYQAETKNADGYRLAYRRGYMYDNSPEAIHWTKITSIYGSQGTYSWLNWNTWSVNRSNNDPTLEYVEMFPWSDGKPFDHDTDMKYSYSYTVGEGDDAVNWDVYTCLNGSYDKLFYKYEEKRGGVFAKTANRDPRLYENATVTGTLQNLALKSADGKATGNVMELWVGGNNAGQCVKHPTANNLVESLTSYCPTGFAAYKYVLNQIEWHRDPNMHWCVLTIPDMILMYAECLAECGRNADAIKQVDLIRARVGMKSINTSSFNKDKQLLTNKDNLIEEILRERACELGMDNARYLDMVRRKRTDWMVKPLHGMATFRMIKNAQNQWIRRNSPWFGDDKDAGMAEPARFEYEFFELIQGVRAQWRKDPNSLEIKKWLLFPFPQDEINKGYGMIQNPGW